MNSSVRGLLVASTILVLIGACDSDTRCEETLRRSLADDEQTPEGLSAIAVRRYTDTLTPTLVEWNSDEVEGDFAPETMMQLSVRRTAETAQYVKTEQVGPLDVALGCGPALVVPVEVSMQTNDGRAQEVLATSIVVTPTYPERIEIYVDLAFDAMQGSLQVMREEARGTVSIGFPGQGETMGWIDAHVVRRVGND